MAQQQESIAGANRTEFHDSTYPYTRSSFADFTLDENLPTPTPPRGQIHPVPKTNLGSLEILPLELLQHILSQLDLRTLEDFQLVDKRALQLVASIPQYKAIKTHALDALRGILSIGTGHWTTCETLYKTLCTAECDQCGDFAGYLYTLTCKRVCFLCFTERETYLPLQHDRAIQKFGVNDQILATLPQMRSAPGTYSLDQKRMPERYTLVDSNSARRAGIELHGSVAAMQEQASKIVEHQIRIPMDRRNGNPFRFMAIVHMPWLDPISKDVEPGRYCIGCAKYTHEFYRDKGNNYYRRLFTANLLSEHLKRFGALDYRGRHKKLDVFPRI